MDNLRPQINDSMKLEVSRWSRLFHTMGIYAVCLVLLGIGSVISPNFLSVDNFLNVIRAVTLLGIVAVGLSFVTYSGHYVDLSIPVIMAFSGIVAISAQPLGITGSITCGLLAGLMVGIINGYIIGYLRLNPIIWTLAMAFMLDGILRWVYGGNQVYPDDTTGTGALFVKLARFDLLDMFPAMSLVLVLLAVLGYLLMKKTRFGIQVQLTGSAYEVARLSGVNVRRIVMLAFIISSFTTAIAGIFLASLVKLGTFQIGEGYDFSAVTAVVIGGVSLTGGRGSIPGVVGGVLVIGLLSNVMTLFGLDSFTQLILKGIVFIAVVGISAYFSRKSGRENA